MLSEKINLTAVDKYVNWFNDTDLRPYLFSDTPTKKEDIAYWLQEIAASKTARYFFIKDAGQIIGHVGLKNIKGHTAEIGIVIGEKAKWEKGIGTVYLKNIISYAQTLGLKKLTAKILKTNYRSQHVFEKLGFVHTGDLLENRCFLRR